MNRHIIPKYKRNLAKSIKYIGGDLARSTMPSISSTVTTTKEAYSEIKQFVLRDRSSLKQTILSQKRAVLKNANEIIENAKSDLKSGKWYNEDRMYGTEGSGMSDLMNSMISDDDSSDMSAFDKVLGSTSAAGMSEAIGNSINNTAVSNTEYLGELSINQHSQNMMMQAKYHMESMKSFKNLENIGMSIMEFNTKTFVDYMKSTQKYQDAALNELRDIRNIMAEQANTINNLTVNKMANRSRDHLANNIFNANGSVNVHGFLANAKDNLSMINPFGFVDPRELLNMLKNSPISTLATLFGSSLIPKKTKRGMTAIDNAFGDSMMNILYAMNNWKNDKNIHGIRKLIGNIAGFDLQKGTKASLTAYKNQELNADLELKKAKAITEVIPSYLSEILKSINGTDKSFNYDTGKFVNNSTIRTNRQKEYTSSVANSMYNTSDVININISKLSKNMDNANLSRLLDDKNTVLTFLVLNLDNIRKIPNGKLTYEDCLKKGLPYLNGGKKSFNMIMASIMAMTPQQFAKFISEAQMATGSAFSAANSMSMSMATSGDSMAFNEISSSKNMRDLVFAKRYGNVNPEHVQHINFTGVKGKSSASEYASMIRKIKSNKNMFKNQNNEDESYFESKTKGIKYKIKNFAENKFGNTKFGNFVSRHINSSGSIDEALNNLAEKMIRYTTEDSINSFFDNHLTKDKFKKDIESKSKDVMTKYRKNIQKTADDVTSKVKSKVQPVIQNTNNIKDNINSKVDKTKRKITGIFSPKPSNTTLVRRPNNTTSNQPISNEEFDIQNTVTNDSNSIKRKIKGARKSIIQDNESAPKTIDNLESNTSNVQSSNKRKIKPTSQNPDKYNSFDILGVKGIIERRKAIQEVRHLLGMPKTRTEVAHDVLVNTINAIKDIFNPNSKNNKLANTIDNTVSKTKKILGTGISAGKGAMVSSLLGMGPMPGMIIGAIFGKRKNNKPVTKTDKEATDTEEEVDKKEKELGKFGRFMKRRKYETVGAAFSTMLGLGPIPGFIVGKIFGKSKYGKIEEPKKNDKTDNENEDNKANNSKPNVEVNKRAIKGYNKLKNNKPVTKTDKEATDTEEEVDKKEDKQTSKIGDVLKRFLVNRKNNLVGMTASTMLGLGPIPGLVASSIYNRKKAADIRKQGAKNKTTVKKFVSNAKKNKALANITLAAEKLQNAKTEEDRASAERLVIAAAAMLGGGAKVAAEEDTTKKGKNLLDSGNGIIDKFKNFLPYVGIIGGLLTSAIFKGIQNIVMKAKDTFNVGLGTENEQGDANFADPYFDKSVGITDLGMAGGLTYAKFKAAAKLSANHPVLSKTINSVGSDIIGAGMANASAKYYDQLSQSYADRYDTVNASGNKMMSIYRKTQAGVRIAKAMPKVLKTTSKALYKASKIDEKSVGILGKIVKKVLGNKRVAQVLGKTGAKLQSFSLNTFLRPMLEKMAAKCGKTMFAKLLTKLAGYANPAGLVILITRCVAAFIRGFNNAAQDLQLDSSFSEGLKLARITNGIIYILDELCLGLLKVTGLSTWAFQTLMKILPFSKEYKEAIANSQEKAKSDYEQFLQENDLNREGYTYEMYQSQINPTIWGNIKKTFTGGDLQAKYKKGGDANKQLKEKYGGYAPITNVDNSTVNNIIMNDTDTGAGGRGIFSPSNTVRNISALLRNTKNTKIHRIRNSKDLEKAMSGAGGRGQSSSTIINNLSKRLNKGSASDIYGSSETNNSVSSYNNYNEMAKDKPSAFNKFKNGIGKIFNNTKNKISGAASSVWNGIKSAGSWIKDKFSSGWQWLTNKFGSGGRGTDPDYYSQDDPRWANMYYGQYNGHKDTVADGGCGPTVAAMALQKLTGQKITPSTMAQLAMSTGMKYDNGGTDPKFFNAAGQQFGINFDRSAGISNSAIRTMASGNPVVLMGKNYSGQSPYGKGTHYILGKGLDRQGNINVLDPQNPRNNKKWKLKDMIKNTAMSITPRGFGRGEETSGTIPRGACVYFRITSGKYVNDGHVGIYDGNGNVWSALSDDKFKSYVVYSDVSKVPFSVINSGNLSYLGYGYNGLDSLNSTQADLIMKTIENQTVTGTNHWCQRWVADVYYKALGGPRKSASSAQAMWDSLSTKFPSDGSPITSGTSETDTSTTGGNKLSKAIGIMNNMFSNSGDNILDTISSMFGDSYTSSNSGGGSDNFVFSGNNSITNGNGKQVDDNTAWKRNVSSYTKDNITKKSLSAAIEKIKPGAGILTHVDDIIKYSNKYGLDPRFVTAMMVWESGWDTDSNKFKQTNNPLGWKVYTGSSGDTYLSLGTALDDILPRIRDQYVNAGQNSLYGFTHPTDVGASANHSYTPGNDFLDRAKTYAKLINNTGGAGGRGENNIKVSPASIQNNSGVKMVHTAIKNKPVEKQIIINKPAENNTQTQNILSGTNLNNVINALNTIIELLGSINSSNTDIANKQQSATVIPINQQTPMMQGITNNKQNILSTIVSGI